MPVASNDLNMFQILEVHRTAFVKISAVFNASIKHNTQVKSSEIWKLLPKELTTAAKETVYNKIGKYITNTDFIKFLHFQTKGGGDYVSYDILIKHYDLKLDNNGMIIFDNNKGFNYTDNIEEPLFLWWILKSVEEDPFCKQFIHHPKLLNFGLQGKIETGILPNANNFKYDAIFTYIKKLFEINEIKHEEADEIINDNVKHCLAILLNYNLSSLELSKVFNVKSKFKEFVETNGNQTVNDILKNNVYLAEFKTKFLFEIRCALMSSDVVRNAYIVTMFEKSLKDKVTGIKARQANELVVLGSYMANDPRVELSVGFVKADMELINHYQELTASLNSEQVIELFKAKELCVKTKDSRAISFEKVLDILRLNRHTNPEKVTDLKVFLRSKTHILDDFYKADDEIFVSWNELSEIISNYGSNVELKKLLELYYREVGDSYEKIIKLMDAHKELLSSNYEVLVTYIEHVTEKLKSTIAIKEAKIAEVTASKNQEIKVLKRMLAEKSHRIGTIQEFFKLRGYDEEFAKSMEVTEEDLLSDLEEYMDAVEVREGPNPRTREEKWAIRDAKKAKVARIAELKAQGLYVEVVEILSPDGSPPLSYNQRTYNESVEKLADVLKNLRMPTAEEIEAIKGVEVIVATTNVFCDDYAEVPNDSDDLGE